MKPQKPVAVDTETASTVLVRSPSCLRKWACLGTGPLVDGKPIQPIRLRNRGPLLWTVSSLEKILGEEIAFDDVEPVAVCDHQIEAAR